MLRMKVTVRIMNDVKMMMFYGSMVGERDSLATLKDAKYTNRKHILQTILKVILLMIQRVNNINWT